MDGDDNKHNIFKKKDLNLSRISRIFKKNPVVPLYGDMQITLESLIKRSPHFDEKVWGSTDSDQRMAQDYEILHALDATRSAHNDYLAKFSNVINDIKISQRLNSESIQTPQECRDITGVVLQGLQLLSDWSSRILQQSAWKYAKPNNDPALESQVDYERVVRYNYTSQERFALVEFIAMTKGLAGCMIKQDALLTGIIRRAIHDELQEFVQVSLREMIRAVSKNTKKKANIRAELLQLRAIAADWMGGTEPVDPALYGKKSSKDEDKVQYPHRNVGPSPTQLGLIRNIVYGLICKKKEFSSSQVKELEEFYSKSHFYPHLLNLTPTVIAITDLADLWYREFYLELSKRLQFPIEMSLPWILTDHILEAKDPAMMEFVLYPLDIYNDASNRALNRLKTRFLYDEIEAEVNLCFDQLLFKLSEQIFTHYKIQASTILLDKPYKTQLEIVHNVGRYNIPKSRYDVLMRQKHFQLLGRTLDISNLVSQRLNTYIKQNIDYAISRFEASDITNVVELEGMLVNIRLTHKLLSEYFELDPWDHFYTEVNESTSLVSFHGRVVLHVIFELMYDFLPNFNFNSITQRFIRTPFTFSQEVPRESMPKTNISFLYGNKALTSAYSNSGELYKKHFGNLHILTLLRLVGKAGLPLVIGEVLRNMELKVGNVLSPYVRELLSSGMPQSSKLPIHDYGTEGGFGYFQLKLKDIFTYPDLRPEVLHNFRIFGNGVLLLNLFDMGLSQIESHSFTTVAPFLGYTPEDMRPSENEAPLYVHLQKLATFLQAKPELCKLPAALQEIVTNAWRSAQFYRPANTYTSLFKSVLHRINDMLGSVRDEWSGTAPENGVVCVDTSSEFYRLWSALQFVVCLPTSEGDASPHELFGDGLMWAGCTIIHFLGQQHRFDLLDFSYHILNVEEAAATPCQKPNMKQFFKTVALVKDINQGIFNLLNVYVPVAKTQWTVLHPPSTDQNEQTFLHPTEDAASPVLQSTSSQNFAPPPPPAFSAPPPPAFGAPPPPPPDFGAPPPPDFGAPPPPFDFGAPPPPPF
jgi:cytoplasmic FMR1 interacting protein